MFLLQKYRKLKQFYRNNFVQNNVNVFIDWRKLCLKWWDYFIKWVV